MNKTLHGAIAAALFATAAVATTAHGDCDDTMLLAQSNVTTGNITQSQSGGSNSQSISIGNTDGAKVKKGKKISSEQNDPETGNSQSANVSGSAKVRQSQDGRGNTPMIIAVETGYV